MFDWIRQPDLSTAITETFWRRALEVRRDHPSTRAAWTGTSGTVWSDVPQLCGSWRKSSVSIFWHSFENDNECCAPLLKVRGLILGEGRSSGSTFQTDLNLCLWNLPDFSFSPVQQKSIFSTLWRVLPQWCFGQLCHDKKNESLRKKTLKNPESGSFPNLGQFRSYATRGRFDSARGPRVTWRHIRSASCFRSFVSRYNFLHM